MTFFDCVLWILPVAAALLVKKSADLVANVIFLSVFSLVVAALYLRMAAPDVAITEAAIGAAVSTLFYLAAIKNTKDHNVQPDTNRMPALIILVSLSLVLLSLLPDIPLFGSEQTPANLHVGSYYIQNTLSQMGVPNAVTSVLGSYRSYDTLGETYVIFTAGIAVLLILPRMKAKAAKAKKAVK